MKLPKINYIGNKEKIADWIIENLPSDVNSFFDAFSGGASVAYAAKKKGLTVYANDILNINYQIAKAFIENNSVTLTKDDIEMLFDGQPFEGFMTKHFSNVFYFPEECKELDLFRSNIRLLNDPFKEALAYALIRRAMVRKMPYSRFTINWDKIVQLRDEEYSYNTYKRKRAYHNKSFKFHVLDNLEDYNAAVFDNGMNNIVYNDDIFNVVRDIHADVIYMDPPYIGTMSNYHGFYSPIDSLILQKEISPFEHSFTDKSDAMELFDNLFSALGNFKYWMLSYNNVSVPTRGQICDLLSKYCKNIQIFATSHKYKVTGKENKNSTVELLFLAERI